MLNTCQTNFLRTMDFVPELAAEPDPGKPTPKDVTEVKDSYLDEACWCGAGRGNEAARFSAPPRAVSPHLPQLDRPLLAFVWLPSPRHRP